MTDQPPASPEREALPIHDGGCQCWPHVSQQDAVRAIEAVALAEYRDGLRRLGPAAQPSADVVGALRRMVEAFGKHHTSSVLGDGSYDELVAAANEALRALAAAQPSADVVGAIEAIPNHYMGGYDAEWDCHYRFDDEDRFPKCEHDNPEHDHELISRERVLEALAAAREAGPPGAGEPGEGLRLLREAEEALNVHAEDFDVWHRISAYLAAHPEPEGREE